MWELEEEEEAAEEDGKAEDVLLPKSDSSFEVSAEEEAVMRVVENETRLRENEKIGGSHSKHRKEMKKTQKTPEINRGMETQQHSLTDIKWKICYLTYVLKVKT